MRPPPPPPPALVAPLSPPSPPWAARAGGAAAVVAAQPLLLALMLVPASGVKFVRVGKRTFALSAVEDERVTAIAESTTKSPSAGPVTVRPDQVWLLPAGIEKVMSVFLALSVTVTPVPMVKVVTAERDMAPLDVMVAELPMANDVGDEIVTLLLVELTTALAPTTTEPPRGKRLMAPFTVIDALAANVTPADESNLKEARAVEQFIVPRKVRVLVTVTDGDEFAGAPVSQYWFMAEASNVHDVAM